MILFLLGPLSLIHSSLLNMDNAPATNWVNPVNTLVTGEVIVERNEHTSSKLCPSINDPSISKRIF